MPWEKYVGSAIMFLTVAEALFAQSPSILVSPPNKAVIVVRWPPSTTVAMIDGASITPRPSEQLFVTPALKRGEKYCYQFEVYWTDQGQEHKVVREVVFQAGEIHEIDFRASPADLQGAPQQAGNGLR